MKNARKHLNDVYSLALVLIVLMSCLARAGYFWEFITTAKGAPTDADRRPDAIAAGRTNSDRITLHPAGRGNSWINLSDGRDLLTSFTGPAELQQALEQNQARPLALCSADYDEDGVPDLICGYAGLGGGLITLHRGNVDAIYPNSPEAQQRRAEGTFTDAPFLSPGYVFAVPEATDFIGAGDFDGDSHRDLVSAARGSDKLYLLPGDGRGGFGAAREIALPGVVTAMVVGEINRRDGLDDVVVGVVAAEGAKVLVFGSPEGALRGRADEFDLPAEATAIATGNLDDEHTMDIAVTAGSELVVIYGRDRKLSLDAQQQATVASARTSKRSFSFGLKGVAIGDFRGDNKTGLSLLASDGSVHLLSPPAKKTRKKNKSVGTASWTDETLETGNWQLATEMVRARVSSIPSDNLVIVDPASRQLHIVAGGKDSSAQGASFQPVSLDVESEPMAVLPMRLNGDALSDLVILKAGLSALSVAMTQPVATFTVTNTNDSGRVR